MQIYEHHVILDEIDIPVQELIDLWKSFPKECNLPWNEYKLTVRPENYSFSPRVYQDAKFKALFTPMHEGKQITEYPVVQKILKQFNWIKKPDYHDITFVSYEKGFKFPVHYDTDLEYNIMFPLIPSQNFEPINFYEGNDRENPGKLIYTLHYSDKHPSIFNGKTLHDVNIIEDFRMAFRIKITNETFESMVKRYKQGKFINA